MYGENFIKDTWYFLHAVLSDQIARIAPRFYIRLTGQTGRGAGKESVQQIADYFKKCFYDYFLLFGIRDCQIEEYLKGKKIIEYGPGNVPGVGLLMLAYGAESVVCVDRLPLFSMSSKTCDVLHCIIDSLDRNMQSKAEACFLKYGDPLSGFIDKRLRYIIRPSGLSGLTEEADLIVSRATLEHVNNLSATFADIRNALCSNGITVHKVDLESHGLHHRNTLDFLTWPFYLWSLMFAHKGCINRWRIDMYREVISENGLKIEIIKPTKMAHRRDIEEVRPYLAAPFSNVTDEDLSWLGFWLVCRKVDSEAVITNEK